MSAGAPRAGSAGGRRIVDDSATSSGLADIALPVATLVLTVGLEVFEAPLLSVLAALRVVEALRTVRR